MLSVPAEAAVQAKRERFKLQRIRENEVAVLQSTTVFVEKYLRDTNVWSFEDKDQNSLTLEVCTCKLNKAVYVYNYVYICSWECIHVCCMCTIVS